MVLVICSGGGGSILAGLCYNAKIKACIYSSISSHVP